MGFFGGANDPITEEIDKATDVNNTTEDWANIISICDKAGKNGDDAKNYLKAICRRLFNNDPHIALQAVTLLDACVKNSGNTFHVEVASRDFENDFNKLMTKGHPETAKKLRECLKKWSENEFKTDKQLNLIPSLYSKLKSGGFDFGSADMSSSKKIAPVSKDPNVVESNEEEEQIMKAIELSLKESTGSPRASANTSLYPSTNLSSVTTPASSSTPPKEPIKVRALYDFEAAEDNELTFSAGEIIFVIDNSDPNWWKGNNQRGEGLFPSNFVTSDLSVEPERFLFEKAKKIVQFKEYVDVKTVKESDDCEINEDKIDTLLHLLHEADPTNPEQDTEEMLVLEREANGMGPLIDSELERVDRKHAQLTQLSSDLVEALNLYHTLMREPAITQLPKMSYGYSQPSMGYNGVQPPNSMSMMSGVPVNMDRQPPYMHPGGPTSMQIYGPSPGSVMYPPPGSAGAMLPPQGMPPHMPQNVTDDRRHDSMNHYGIPNYGPPSGGMPPNFQIAAPVSSQTSLQNGQPQQ